MLYNVALDPYDYDQIINGITNNSSSPFEVSIDLPAVIEPDSGLKGSVTFFSDTEGGMRRQLSFLAMRE